MRFIRVTKDNSHKERGFIAVDAICSVFENGDTGNLSIMTMDGFWYDVLGNIEDVYRLVVDSSSSERNSLSPRTKSEYYKTKRMRPYTAGADKAPVNNTNRGDRASISKVSSMRSYKKDKVDLPSGEGEGCRMRDSTVLLESGEQ